jgi:hypothetical protein
MTIETLDLTFDTRTELPEDFTCFCEILILGPNLIELLDDFLQGNGHVKTLDMSKCINLTEIPDYFCSYSYIENIIWPPNINTIERILLYKNFCIKTVDLSNCNQLTVIENDFCSYSGVVNIILPISIQTISHGFCNSNKYLATLDFSYCINLRYIGLYFCTDTNIQSIKFPKSLQIIDPYICFNSDVQELDFSECKDVRIYTFHMCSVEILKLYSIDNIDTVNKIYCKNLYIYNITETKSLDLTFIEGLQNVYLPEGEYCIICKSLNVKFWLGDSIFPVEYFKDTALHVYSYLPVSKLAIVDPQLDIV